MAWKPSNIEQNIVETLAGPKMGTVAFCHPVLRELKEIKGRERLITREIRKKKADDTTKSAKEMTERNLKGTLVKS